MKVRVGIERWHARLADDGTLPVGTQVRVAAVDGALLRVEPSTPA